MRFHKVVVQSGGLFLERRASTPGYTQEAQGRMMYDQGQDQVYYGCDRTDVASYVPLFDAAHDLNPLVGSTYKIGDSGGTFAEVHADNLYGNLTGNVTGNVTGDLTGDVLGDLQGDVKSDNGSIVLNNGPTPSASTYLGTATKAKYA